MKGKTGPRLPNYESKPEKRNDRLRRTCLMEGCGKKFNAETPFLRLCPYHRRDGE